VLLSAVPVCSQKRKKIRDDIENYDEPKEGAAADKPSPSGSSSGGSSSSSGSDSDAEERKVRHTSTQQPSECQDSQQLCCWSVSVTLFAGAAARCLLQACLLIAHAPQQPALCADAAACS
jgi:hypothetical protein